MYESRSVLVIDDEVVSRSVTMRLLRQLGVGTVIEAADGAEALARCDRVAFDAIFCDVEMAPVDGLTFIDRLRSRDAAAGRDSPVVMLTKHADSGIVRSARDQGAAAYLVKPVTAAGLRDKLDRVLEPQAVD